MRKDVEKFYFLNRTGREWNELESGVFRVEDGGSVRTFRKNMTSLNTVT